MGKLNNGDKVTVLCENRYYKGKISDLVRDVRKGYKFFLKDDQGKYVVVPRPGIPSILPTPFYEKHISNFIIPKTEKEKPKELKIHSINLEKIENLSSFFREHVTVGGKAFNLDTDQLLAVLSDKNTLLTARAGSGKTRVLTAKLIYLMEKMKLDASQVMAFCFNADASDEINKRLVLDCLIDGKSKFDGLQIAKTFHAFAYRNLDIKTEILAKQKGLLIKDIVEDFQKDKDFKKLVYNFFKTETRRVDGKSFKDKYSYYQYVKNSDYRTLNGERVKSRAEKFIADYLFEHGINYYYEKPFYPKQANIDNSVASREQINVFNKVYKKESATKPDFYLVDYKLIWEHWAIDGTESAQEIEEFNNLFNSYERYKINKSWKKMFWGGELRKLIKNDNKYGVEIKDVVNLIETNDKMFDRLNTKHFEEIIENLLIENGVVCEKLDQQSLIDKAWEKVETEFTKLVTNYVNKFQQTFFDNEEEYFNQKNNICLDQKTQMFLDIGYKVYKKYLEILNSNNLSGVFKKYELYKKDFNQLIYDASLRIRNGDFDYYLKEVKWILIDEYQDFSRLFKYLIDSILMRNKEIKLFCVGDDWQAINRFAGAHLKYFERFGEYYKNTEKLSMSNNYRSSRAIVNYSNKFMDYMGFYGNRAIPNSNVMGEVQKIDIKNTLSYNKTGVYLEIEKLHNSRKYQLINYLKICSDIIFKNPKKQIKILSRSNMICNIELDDFKKYLYKSCYNFLKWSDFNELIEVKTVHKSKGEEAEIVIILNVNERSFPIYNENNSMFEVFGDSMEDSVSDEIRLYYVAITRAIKKLYVLYEGDCKSEYVF